MRYIKYLALLALLVLPMAYSQAQVSIGVQIGPSYGVYNAPPVCPYGFYPSYPFGCAPYGYYASDWFVDGVFIGAGPWYNFYYTHPGFYRPYYFNRGFGFHEGFRGFRGEGFRDDDFRRFHDHDGGFRRFHDDDRFRGEGFRGFRGGERFRGDERGFRGGDRGFRNEGFRSFNGGPRGFRGGEGGGRGFEGG